MSVLYEGATPFFIVPKYEKILGSNYWDTFQKILSELDVHTYDYVDEIFTDPILESSYPVSGSSCNFVVFYPQVMGIGIWNKRPPSFPTFSQTFTASFSGVETLRDIPWDANNHPSVFLKLSQPGARGYVNGLNRWTGRGFRMFALYFESPTDPTAWNDTIIKIDETGRIRIWMDVFSPVSVTYYQFSHNTTIGAGVINTTDPMSFGILDNAIEIGGESFLWDDGYPPNVVLCRSWDDNRRTMGQYKPGVYGEWKFTVYSPQYDLTFIRDGCQPITHGPLLVQ